jgi:glyoxylase-like metal-dependent hydrolase (beta-lactamase superfamily II)
VLATPGHTRGHVVFHDPGGRLLFAGDHILPRITPSIGFEPALSDDPLGAFLGSLTLIRSRPDARLLPAHGPAGPSAHARVDELIAHQMLAVLETRAHLDLLAAQGRLARQDHDGLRYYRPAGA